jgi:hypothetical protein
MLARYGLLALVACTAFAQDTRLTNATIIEMTSAGTAPDAIVQKIVSSPAPDFHLDPASVSSLVSHGVDESVIRAMAARQTGRRVPEITAASGSLPTKVGVYLHSPQGLWVELEQEGAHWQKANVLKDVFNLAGGKEDGDATVSGKISPNSAETKELLVVAPEGVSVTEYQLLRLREHGNARQFREAPAHVSPDYTQKKLASCTYLVNLSDKLQPGEYALLPPGPFASRTVAAGKIYSFRVAGTKN